MSRDYKIDFYELLVTATPQVSTPEAGFDLFLNETINTNHRDGAYTREIFGLERRTDRCLTGALRKFRTDDLPEIARIGEEAEHIDLDDGQALVERNCFVFYPTHSLLGWQVDGHGSHPARFEKFLSELWGTRVALRPVIQPDAIQRLLSGTVEMKSIDVNIARPQNPDLFPSNDFSASMLSLLNESGADSIKLRLGVDLRRDRDGRLVDGVKSILTGLFRAGATTAKADVFEEGVQHTIDLIADRVSSTQTTDTDGRVPSNTIYSLIDNAKQELQSVLDGYFSNGNETLN